MKKSKVVSKSNIEVFNLIRYGNSYNNILDKLCSLILSLTPILQHYRGLVENAGFTALILCGILMTVRLFINNSKTKLRERTFYCIIPVLLYEIYSLIIHFTDINFMRYIYIFFICFVFICIASGCVNTSLFFKYSLYIAIVNFCVLVIQYFCYYVLHFRAEFRALSLLVDQDSIWIRHAQNYTTDTSGFYRPSGFFLEPSHFYLYCFPLLCLLLLQPGITKWRKQMAVILSLAMLMSTSGFSVFAVVLIWFLYILFYRDSDFNKTNPILKLFRPRNLMILFVLIIAVVIAYYRIPIIHQSFNRVFNTSDLRSNAISGRIRLALNYVQDIHGLSVLIGQSGVTSTLDFNLSGFFATYIKYGIIGLVLSYWFYLRGLFKLKKAYFWLSVLIIVTSFFSAHTHGTFYMTYYILFLMNGYFERRLKYIV